VTAVADPRTAAPAAPAREPAAPAGPRSWLPLGRAYLALTKPRIVELLLVTTVPAMLLADPADPSLALIAVVLVGGSLAAGAANALNCFLDRDIDVLMRRTSRRPLPAHTVSPRAALVFGLSLAAAATLSWPSPPTGWPPRSPSGRSPTTTSSTRCG
jgi:protoheme IX farnesyltransferase